MCEHAAAHESLELALHEQGGAPLVLTSVELPEEGLKVVADYAVEHPMLRGATHVRAGSRLARRCAVKLHDDSAPSRLVPQFAPAPTLRIADDIDKARFGREIELSKVAQALLTWHYDGPGLIWGSFDRRPALRNAARDAGCFTEQEIRHLSLHDLQHGALTELASVSPNLPGIAHIARHKRVSTTTQYVHSNREQTRAVLNARPGIPVTIPFTDAKSADLKDIATVLTLRNHNASEGGGIGRRAGFRLQDQNANAPLFLSETRPGPRPEDVGECPQWTHFGHGDRNEKGAVALSDVQRAAAALLHRVADGGEIPIEVLREFAELVLRLELVELSRQVLGGPPEFAVRRALELASLVLGVRVVDDAEKGKDGAG